MLLLSPRSFSSVFAFLLFMLLGGGPLLSLEPQRSISQYGHDRWDLRNGLPGSAVDRLYQLSDGYLWLLSEGKLFRFDGVRFSPILLDVKGQTVDEAIRAVALDSAHRLLVRTRTRILRLDQGHFSDAAPPVSLPDGMDTAICQTRDGAFWIGSDNHLFRLWEGRLGMVVQGAGKVYSILEDRSGAL